MGTLFIWTSWPSLIFPSVSSEFQGFFQVRGDRGLELVDWQWVMLLHNKQLARYLEI